MAEAVVREHWDNVFRVNNPGKKPRYIEARYDLRSLLVQRIKKAIGFCEHPGCKMRVASMHLKEDAYYSKPHRYFHFHHIDPKSRRFGLNALGTRSIREILAEIAKCQMLCPPHHYEAHRELRAARLQGVA
jgi:hypothetical protein